MDRFKWWIFKILAKNICRQGDHQFNTKKALTILFTEYRDQFSEEGYPANESYLNEYVSEALDRSKNKTGVIHGSFNGGKEGVQILPNDHR